MKLLPTMPLHPSAVLLLSLPWKIIVFLWEKEGMQTIPCNLHFIRKWIVHLQLGLSFIEKSSVDLHHNIQRSLGKAHCSLCWAGPEVHCECSHHFFSSIPHLCVMTGEFFPLEITHVISLITIPDALFMTQPSSTLQSIAIQSTRWSHLMNLLYTLPYVHGRRILCGSIQSGIRSRP